jgi:tetratricopeptide (TPR) repeat protein
LPSLFDSRAFVHFRAGEMDAALEDCNAALAIAPKLASSLFMRGIVRLRLGHADEGQADLLAAREIDPSIDGIYARFGVHP